MTPEQIDRVFGRGRLKMATGEHVEVFREAVAPGERRRYTKRFLNTTDGDFAHWTEREWRILARLIGHGIGCVPEVVQFDRGSIGGSQLVQTYDAGATVDQWATLLPLIREGRVYRHVFEDCAHWWALAHRCLIAFKDIHQLQLVHLDVKGDNVCIPLGPPSFDPDATGGRLYPIFSQLALIDFAFALVSGEALAQPLPIGWQREYDYQSPRLLKALEEGRNGDLGPTRRLDWRCDMYSLAAMLKRYLPDEAAVHQPAAAGWTAERYDAAKALILALREHHDRDAPQARPHAALINATGARLREKDLALSLASGWTLARDIDFVPAAVSPPTPMTRLAPSIRVFLSPPARVSDDSQITATSGRDAIIPLIIPPRDDPVHDQRVHSVARRVGASRGALAAATLAVLAAIVAVAGPALFPDGSRVVFDRARAWVAAMLPQGESPASSSVTPKASREPSEPSAAPTQVADAPVEPNVPSPVSTSETDAQSATPKGPLESNAPEPKATTPIASSVGRSQDPAPSKLAASLTPMRTPTVSRTVGSGGTKAKSSSRAAPSSRSATAGAAQKALPASTASRMAASVDRAAPPSSLAHAVPGRVQAFARSEPRPAPAQVSLASPVEHAVTPPPASPPPALPMESNAPARTTEIPESQRASTHIADAPTVAPPQPREHSRPSRSGRAVGQGWLSQLLGLVGNKPAPIEDRQLLAGAPKKSATDVRQSTARFAPSNPQPATEQAKTATLPSPPTDATATSAQVVARDDSDAAQRDVAQAVQLPAKIPSPPTVPPAPIRAIPEPPGESDFVGRNDVFASEGRRALRQFVPRAAVQAQSAVAGVLWVAEDADDIAQARTVIEAAQSMWVGDDQSSFSQGIAPAEARRLNDEASDAYWSRRNVSEAFDLQLKAFGANPYDAEIAGNLAMLHLKAGRLQPETARQLALVALAYRSARTPAGRLEDWNTYAIASALTGHAADARNAMFVVVALSRNVERSCKAALGALSSYGERLRDPVEAMFYRLHTQGRAYESPYCAWPRKWAMGPRIP